MGFCCRSGLVGRRAIVLMFSYAIYWLCIRIRTVRLNCKMTTNMATADIKKYETSWKPELCECAVCVPDGNNLNGKTVTLFVFWNYSFYVSTLVLNVSQ